MKLSKLFSATVVGSVNIDHVIRVKHLPAPGETVSGLDYQTHAGGKGANQAVSAARLGGDIEFIACLGDDETSQKMHYQLSREGVKTMGVKLVPNSKTGCAFITVDSQGENTITLSSEANNKLNADRVNQHAYLIESADALLIQLETPIEGVLAAATLAKSKEVLVLLDPAPADRFSDALWPLVDIMTPNIREAEKLTGMTLDSIEAVERAAALIAAKGPQIVIITLGQQGVFLRSSEHNQHIPAFDVDTIDSTACGDVFNGALLAELHRTDDLLEAVRFAQAAAALAATRLGAQFSVPSLDEVIEMLDSFYDQDFAQAEPTSF